MTGGINTSTEFRAARRRLGIDVRHAAELCNVTPRTIRRWETGAGHGDGRNPHPSACRVLEIAAGLYFVAIRETPNGRANETP